jgi:hypothetical protein
MIASVLIIVFSAVLLVYWFRYSCLLLIRSQAQPAGVATDSRFQFGEVQNRLAGAGQLDPLERSLQRDYEVLVFLLEHAVGLELRSFEDRLLVLDYRVMRWWYRFTRTAAPEQARRALGEMASVLGILAGRIDQRAGLHNEA